MKTIEVVFVCDPPSVTSQSLVEDSTSSTIPPGSFKVCHRAQVLPSKCATGHKFIKLQLCVLSPNMGKLPHSISSGSQYT